MQKTMLRHKLSQAFSVALCLRGKRFYHQDTEARRKNVRFSFKSFGMLLGCIESDILRLPQPHSGLLRMRKESLA